MDRNNTMTLTDMQEVERMLNPEDGGRPKKKQEDAIRYQSDNELIIQPIGIKEAKRGGGGTLLNIAIGLLIGAAAVYFLVVPAVRTNERLAAQEQITAIGNKLTVKDTRIEELSNELNDLKASQKEMQGALDGYAETDELLAGTEGLLNTTAFYLSAGDVYQVSDELARIKESMVLEDCPNAFRNLYSAIFATITPQIVETGYTEGFAAYNSGKYEDALVLFERVVRHDETHVNAWFYLGRSYHHLERFDEAVTIYQKVLEIAEPGTDKARDAQTYIDRLTSNQ